VYRLLTTPDYEDELREIGPEAEITRALESTLYQTLREDPKRGELSRHTGLWWIRRRLLMGLLLVQVAYRIDEGNQTVTLVSIIDIDQTRL